MIHPTDFQAAIQVLDGLTSENVHLDRRIAFGEEYSGQHQVITALKILHRVALEGTGKQKTELLASRHKIIALNSQLRSPDFNRLVYDKLGIEMGAESVVGIQLALPQTKLGKMREIATKIPRIFFTILLDIVLLPGALVLLLVACCRPNFNPKPEALKGKKIAVLALHGSGFNETEWVIGRLFLKNVVPVFSLNYDGLVSNVSTMGIEDYAREKISAEVKRIKALGIENLIILGHSQGGLIGGCYTERYADADGVTVNHVISIASPWQGTPMIDCFWKLGGCFSKKRETKRHQQMSLSGGTDADPLFRQTLVAQALDSERRGARKYYNIFSTTDYAVPGMHGGLTEDPRRQRKFNFLGHYGSVVWPTVWLQIRSWLRPVLAEQLRAT